MKKIPGRARLGFVSSLATLALTAAWAMSGGGITLTASPQKKGKGAKERVPDTLILVSTFAETGQTLRGVRVRLYPADADGNTVKGRTLDGQTNNMGEFPFHVPQTEATYVLVAEIKGFARTEKPVKVQGEEKLDIFVQMPVAR